MRNIHILPTKPNDETAKGIWIKETRDWCNIYITSDEEIKVNDYITDGYLVWKWKDDSSLLGRKKVILTTDPDLINDGVQAIDDDFLEWFVKNPSCEEVEIQVFKSEDCDCYYTKFCNSTMLDKTKHCRDGGEIKRLYKIIIPKEEPKQETLEEAAEKYSSISFSGRQDLYDGFIEGAKYQAEVSEQTTIEFLEFAWKQGYEKYTNSKEEEYWCKKSEVSLGKFLTTKELFQEFLKQRQ